MLRSKAVTGIVWSLLLFALHLWPGVLPPSHAQGSRKDDIVFNSRGVPLAGASIRVCAMPATGQPCAPLALIYSDAALTQALANPTTSDGLGNYFFYAAPGKYEIEISGPNITTRQIPNVLLPSDPSSPTFTGAISAFTLNLSGNLTVNGSTTVVGNLASGTLTLSNQGTPPGAASSGTVNLYTKSVDKRLYYKDETGLEVGPILNAAGAQTNTTNTFTAPQNIDADFHTKGPNPFYDITRFGGYIGPNYNSPTTGSINSGSTALTLALASDFANGQGILVLGAGPSPVIPTPQAPSVTPIAQTGSTSYSYCVADTDWFGGRTSCSPTGSTASGAAAFGLQTYTVSNWSRASGVVTLTTSAPHNIPLTSYNSGYPQIEVQANSTNSRYCEGAFTLVGVPSTTTVQFTQFGLPDSTSCTGGTLRILPKVVLKWDSHATYNLSAASCSAGTATVTISPGVYGANGTWSVPWFVKAIMSGILDTHYNATAAIFNYANGVNPTTIQYAIPGANGSCTGINNVAAGGTVTLVPGKAVKNHLVYRCSGASCALPANAANFSLVGVATGNDGYFVDTGVGVTAAAIDLGDPSTTAPTASTNDYLNTLISSGGGTTSLTLAVPASRTVSAVKVFHDNTPNLYQACAAIPTSGINASGAHIVIPSVASGTGSFFPIASNFDAYGNIGQPQRNCPGNVTFDFRAQTWLLGTILVSGGDNFIADQGSTNCTPPFYNFGSALTCMSGYAYPFFYFEPEESSNNFFQNLLLLPNQNYQSGLFFDFQFNGDGATSTRLDHVHVSGQANSMPYVDKTGFGRFWNFGGWAVANNNFSSGHPATFITACGQPTYNVIPNFSAIIYTTNTYSFGTNIVDGCGQSSGPFVHATFREQLVESTAGPAWLFNTLPYGLSQVTFDSGSYADPTGGFSTPFFDLTNSASTGTSFTNNGCATGFQPLLQTGTVPTYNGVNVVSTAGSTCAYLGVQNYHYENTQGSLGVDSNYNRQISGSSQVFSSMAAPANFQSVTQLGAGNVPVGTYTYCLTASDLLGGETASSPTPCTTFNVTTQASVVQFVLPAAFPPGAAGVNLYVNGALANANGCVKPQYTIPGGTYTYNSSFGCGNSPPSVSTAVSTALTTSAIAAPKLLLNGEFTGSVARSEQNIFLPGALTSAWTASTWTPDKGVTVSRVQVQAKTAPAGCTTNAVVRLTDGTTPVNVTVAAAANDSGPIAQNYAASTPLTVSVLTAAAGCTTSPADVNVTIQYRMQ